MDLEILGGVYKIPLTLMGSSNTSIKDAANKLKKEITDLQTEIKNIENSKSDLKSVREELNQKRRDLEAAKEQYENLIQRQTRGPLAKPEDFIPNKNPITDDQIE